MKTIRLLTLLGSLVWLASCSSDNDELFPEPQSDGQIKFEISFAGESGNPKTKVATATNFTSTWEGSDKIGVYIVKGSGGLLASGNYADNIEFTYSGGTWTTSNPQYYPNDGDDLSFYAYYPYDAGMTNPNAYTFNVPIDQANGGGEYYKKNDFLWAKNDGVAKSDNAVPLQFSHALAMIEIAITDVENIAPAVDIKEAVTDCTINLADQSIISGSTKNTIQMWRRYTISQASNRTFFRWALVPPQTMDIRFVWTKNNIAYTVTPATNVTLTSGSIKKYSTTQP